MDITISREMDAWEKCRKAIAELMIQSYYGAPLKEIRNERQRLIKELSDALLGPGIEYEVLT